MKSFSFITSLVSASGNWFWWEPAGTWSGAIVAWLHRCPQRARLKAPSVTSLQHNNQTRLHQISIQKKTMDGKKTCLEIQEIYNYIISVEFITHSKYCHFISFRCDYLKVFWLIQKNHSITELQSVFFSIFTWWPSLWDAGIYILKKVVLIPTVGLLHVLW